MKIAINSSIVYVAANVAISALGFLRNIYFMRSMSHGDLGQVAMLQTIVVIVGFLQLGMINGGYRLYAGADATTASRINSTVLTCFITISSLLLPSILSFQYLGNLTIKNVESETLLLGCVVGLATLASTWLNNTLIAKGRLGISSSVNFCAAIISLSLTLIPEALSVNQAFLAILLQPLMVMTLALIIHPPSRPALFIDKALTKEIVNLGFAPFCAGIVALINFQIERWFIVSYLGTEAMGTYYLTIVYTTVFTLIPVSLLNLFYPKTVNAYEQRDRAIFTTLTRKHLLILLGYLSIAVIFTVLFLPVVLDSYLESFKGYQHLVFISLPGLVAFTLFDNIALILQSAKKMLNLFLFAMLALIFNLLALFVSIYTGHFTLEVSVAIKSISFIAAALVIAIDLFVRKRALLSWD